MVILCNQREIMVACPQNRMRLVLRYRALLTEGQGVISSYRYALREPNLKTDWGGCLSLPMFRCLSFSVDKDGRWSHCPLLWRTSRLHPDCPICTKT